MVKSHPQKFVELQPQSNNHHWGFLGLLPLPKCSIRPGGTAVCLPPVRGSRGLAPCRAKRPAISCGKRSRFHGQVPWDEWAMVSYGHPSNANPFDRLDSGGYYKIIQYINPWWLGDDHPSTWDHELWPRFGGDCKFSAGDTPSPHVQHLVSCAFFWWTFQTNHGMKDLQQFYSNLGRYDPKILIGWWILDPISHHVKREPQQQTHDLCFSNFALVFGARQLVNSLKVCGEVQKSTDPAQAWESRQATSHRGPSILWKI